jgi:hypothetical protein
MPVQFSVPAPDATPAAAAAADADWPLGKLSARLRTLRETGESRKPAVLLTTGAMNPVHLGHVDMFARARRCLEQEHGYCVLAGYISPSHEDYVRPKCAHFKQRYLGADVRLECVRRAVQASDWLACGAWEAAPAHGSWPDYPVVVKALQSYLGGQPDLRLGGHKCTVFYVCGLDHFQKCQLAAGLRPCSSLPGTSCVEPKAGVVAIPRAGKSAARSNLEKLVVGVTELNPELSDLSSTAVRKLLKSAGGPKQPALGKRRAAIAEVVGEDVADFLLQVHNLGDRSEAAAAAAAAAEPESEPAPIKELQSRDIVISCSTLIRCWQDIPPQVLDKVLFLFGSKRCWVFPQTDEERRDAQRQPGRYHKMNPELLALIAAKEERGEVHFLKRNDLQYECYPGRKPYLLFFLTKLFLFSCACVMVVLVAVVVYLCVYVRGGGGGGGGSHMTNL